VSLQVGDWKVVWRERRNVGARGGRRGQSGKGRKGHRVSLWKYKKHNIGNVLMGKSLIVKQKSREGCGPSPGERKKAEWEYATLATV